MRDLDSVALARLKNMRFSLRRHLAEGNLTGRHRSLRHGFAQEFAQHRAYVPGDELKHLDWKVFARKERFFVKEFQEEKSLKTYLLLDASGSMSYRGSGSEPKWDLACRLSLAMAYLVLGQGDAAGLLTFDVVQRDFVTPRQSLGHLERMDRVLAESKPGGETDLAQVLLKVGNRIPRRSLLVLVSDLLGDSPAILETIKTLHARKHRILVFQVLDPMERDIDLEGPVLFEGLEDRETLRCEAALIREAYREEFARQQRLYEASFRQAGIFFDTFYTDASWDQGLTRFLALQNSIG